MSVEQTNVIDVMSVDPQTREIRLTISDHLEWSQPGEHLLLLQEKLNTYLAFVEGGQILDHFPNAEERLVVLKVVFRHPPDKMGEEFLARAKQIVADAGFVLRFETFVTDD